MVHNGRRKEGENMARVTRSDDGRSIFVMDGEFCASRQDGKWEPGSLYDHYELSEFRTVRDKAEAEALLKEAHKAVPRLATA